MTAATPTAGPSDALTTHDEEFKRHLGLFDSTMVVAGSMIGSAIFIVAAEMARTVGSAGWLMVAWLVTGVITVMGALSYGELAAMMPRAGGQYVYLREAFSPLVGFLYGWTLFLVIQTGTVAAVAIGFARHLGVLWPAIGESRYLIAPIHLSQHYVVSLSTVQAIAILMIALLTWSNSRGVDYGRIVQNVFTTTKMATLAGVILIAVLWGRNPAAIADHLAYFWTPRNTDPIAPGLSVMSAFGTLVAVCLSQSGSLFAADAWNNITFTAGEVKEPRRNIPLSLALGTGIVIALYVLVNVAFLVTLPLEQVQHAPLDRVATATINAIFPGIGTGIMAMAVMISTFGCNNGLIFAGARLYYAMSRDGLFFKPAGRLNDAKVPGWGLKLQGLWASLLLLPRTFDPTTGAYGNVYSSLLDYVISAALIFYILTVVGLFRLRRLRPDADRPYRAIGYPLVPALYVIGCTVILLMLFLYRPATTWPGIVIVLLGVPVYFAWRE